MKIEETDGSVSVGRRSRVTHGSVTEEEHRYLRPQTKEEGRSLQVRGQSGQRHGRPETKRVCKYCLYTRHLTRTDSLHLSL